MRLRDVIEKMRNAANIGGVTDGEILAWAAELAALAAGDGAVAIIGECAEVQWLNGGPCQLPPGARLFTNPAGAAQVTDEAVGEVIDGFAIHCRAVNLYGPVRCQPKPGTKLFTRPSAVTDEMVECALSALEEAAEGEDGRNLIWQSFGSEDERLEAMRAALTAALNPGGSRE